MSEFGAIPGIYNTSLCLSVQKHHLLYTGDEYPEPCTMLWKAMMKIGAFLLVLNSELLRIKVKPSTGCLWLLPLDFLTIH